MEFFSQENVVGHIREIIILAFFFNILLTYLLCSLNETVKRHCVLNTKNIHTTEENFSEVAAQSICIKRTLDNHLDALSNLEKKLDKVVMRLDNEILVTTSRFTALENPVVKKAGKKVNPRTKKTYKRGPYVKKTTKKTKA